MIYTDLRAEYRAAIREARRKGRLSWDASRLALALSCHSDEVGRIRPDPSWHALLDWLGMPYGETGTRLRSHLRRCGMLASDGEGAWFLIHPAEWPEPDQADQVAA